MAPKTTAHPKSDTDVEKDKRKNKGEPNTRLMGPPDTPHSELRTGQRPSEEYLCDLDAAKKGLSELEPTEHTSTINKDTEKQPPNLH